MDMQFKYLVNPNPKPFVFQHDGNIYEVPPQSRKLYPKEVAEHGFKRSRYATDAVVNSEGTVLDKGNDIYALCRLEDAETTFQVEKAEPILLDKNRYEKMDLAIAVSSDPQNSANRKEGVPEYPGQPISVKKGPALKKPSERLQEV
jgi:hypothetical protein